MNPNWAFTPPPEHRRHSEVPAVRPVLIAAVLVALAVTIMLGAVAIRSVRPVQAQPTPVLPLPTAPPPPAFPLPTALPPPAFPLPTMPPPPMYPLPTAIGPAPTPTGPLPTPTGPLPTPTAPLPTPTAPLPTVVP